MTFLICVSRLTFGGAERVAVCWANGLAKLGHDVTLMADFSWPVSYALSPEVKRLQASKGRGPALIRKISKNIGCMLQIRRFCKKNKPAAVIDVLYYRAIPMLLAVKSLRKRPVLVQTDHNDFKRALSLPKLNSQRLDKFVLSRFFDILTVLTRADLEIMKNRGAKNVRVLHNPLFLLPVSSVPAKENIVLACGRLNVWHTKGFDVLIKAWNQVGANHPDWKLRIVGAGTEAELALLRHIHQGASALEFAPYTEDIVAEYSRAAIFVLSSRFEGWGLVLVEAMSQACAAIACDYEGRQAEIISNGHNGLLCQTDNVGALANEIEKLISDSALRHRLQLAAPESVKIFSEENTARNLIKTILCR